MEQSPSAVMAQDTSEALGCFTCHGLAGAAGIPDPSDASLNVPDWNGGVWMMYVESDEQIERIILDGSSVGSHASAIPMPAYRELIGPDDLGRDERSEVGNFRTTWLHDRQGTEMFLLSWSGWIRWSEQPVVLHWDDSGLVRPCVRRPLGYTQWLRNSSGGYEGVNPPW